MSKLVREAMRYRGSIVASLNQSRNGATRWVIPMDPDLACIICHAVAGARKGDTVSGWTRERGARDARGTETLSGIGVSGGRRGCLGERHAIRSSIYAAWGILTSPGVSNSGFTTTVARRRPRRMSLSKARTFPSCGVGWAKDGVPIELPRARVCVALGP